MKKIILLGILFTLTLQADCSSYYLLGAKKQSLKQTISSKDTVVWKSSKNRWSVSKPKENLNLSALNCEDSAYLLINNNDISYKTPDYTKESYSLKRGWNYLAGHVNGVDVEKTFKSANGVEFIYVYDKPTKAWAGYSPIKHIQSNIDNTRVLSLKKVEPNVGFYVYAKKSMSLKIRSVEINSTCMKLINDDKFATLTDSGITNAYAYNEDKTIALKSRYFSHYRRGVYSETRVMLIYPKSTVKTQRIYKYGPASPKSMMEFSKEYEGKEFYMYDFKDEKCYMGVFPSEKIPPFSSLKELK